MLRSGTIHAGVESPFAWWRLVAAVVLGGTSILGGRGSYLGTVAGVMLITLLQSILSVMQMPEFGRQIVYGIVIIMMLLLYGRERLQR